MAGALATLPLPAAALMLNPTKRYMMNRWKQDQHLHIQRGKLESSQIEFGWWSAQWRMSSQFIGKFQDPAMHQHLAGWFYITNAWKPKTFLHLENGHLEASECGETRESALWTFDDAGDGFVQIRNRQRTEFYIHLDAFGFAKAGRIPAGYWSGRWRTYIVPQQYR